MAKAKRGFDFNSILVRKPNYSKINLSHDHLVSIEQGRLTPIWWTETVPGDTWRINLSGFCRLLALSSPMLQRQDIYVRAFKVPFRILYNQDDLDKCFAGSKTGVHLDMPSMICSANHMKVGSLYDYLGLPLPYVFNGSTNSWEFNGESVTTSPHINPSAFLAYHRIFHDHFRNEETSDDFLELFKQKFSVFDGEDIYQPVNHFFSTSQGWYFDALHRVCWERDYFTSALSSPQRGAQVNIPLLGNAPVKADSTGYPVFESNSVPGQGTETNVLTKNYPQTRIFRDSTISNDLALKWSDPHLVVDGSEFSGIGAIALRMAMNLQAFLERNNVAGYRMIGNVLAHFGVHSSNQLNDEAEYLGGIKAPVTISAVNQTSATAPNSTPQGTQVGTGQSSFTDHLCSTFCEERGIIMVVAYISSKSSYSQGLARKWTRFNYLDFYWPEFQSIGEQEILNKEVFFPFNNEYGSGGENGTWAYQSRFSEYKYEPDSIAGDFRTTLSYWHQSRLFRTAPSFNADFVRANPSYRVFALDADTYPRPYLCEFYFDAQVVRPMDKYAQSKLW